MKALLWRVIYAAIGIVMLFYILPLFLSVIGLAPPGDLLQLVKICLAFIAVLYVLFGPAPPAPF